MTIRIVTDRTCDLTPEIAEQYGIGIVPCYINGGEKSYLDGADILREDFYAQLPYFNPHPKTSAPGIGMYSAVYQRLANEGADQIISIHIHSGLSNLSNAAGLAAEAADKIRVTVVEAGQLTIGLGFLAIAAAQAARKGRSADEILKIIKGQDERTFVLFAIDTLEYLRLSGRAPGLVVSIANLLRIKPIIQLHRGELRPVGQERTTTKSIDHLVNRMKKLGKMEQLAVLHTSAHEKAGLLAEKLKAQISQKLDIWVSEVTPVLGVHVGPGLVGIACAWQRNKYRKNYEKTN